MFGSLIILLYICIYQMRNGSHLKLKKTMKKYNAKLHVNANSENVKFIGTVEANSIKELKENARQKARNQGNYGRIHVDEENEGLEFFVNA